MRLLRYLLALLFFFSNQLVAEEVVVLQPVTVDLSDKPSLQRGARFFMNYCSGCHSLKYLRYERMAKDIGLTQFDGSVDNDLLYNNLIFTEAKRYSPIEVAMPATDARQWFGKVPPDLSLTARQRGVAWIFTYLKSFYIDKDRPFGANNLLLPAVSMPNILAPLQGQVIASGTKIGAPELVLLQQGTMGEQEFEQALVDLVNFLAYAAEPAKLQRDKIGPWVLLFLFIFLGFAYQLKQSYWKELH